MKITKEILEKDLNIEGAFKVTVTIDGEKIDFTLDPDDASMNDTIKLANKLLNNFELYKKRAVTIIVKDFLDIYNNSWADDEFPILNEAGFVKNLKLTGIHFLSKDCIDLFFSENGMFGNHSLIAQSFDGEHFNDSTMYG